MAVGLLREYSSFRRFGFPMILGTCIHVVVSKEVFILASYSLYEYLSQQAGGDSGEEINV